MDSDSFTGQLLKSASPTQILKTEFPTKLTAIDLGGVQRGGSNQFFEKLRSKE
jgi:hypothetical protein